jgi:hypothetical protein
MLSNPILFIFKAGQTIFLFIFTTHTDESYRSDAMNASSLDLASENIIISLRVMKQDMTESSSISRSSDEAAIQALSIIDRWLEQR